VEALTNDEEVELRSKIEALGLEVTKVPSSSTRHLDEVFVSRLSSNRVSIVSGSISENPRFHSMLGSL